MIIRMGKAALLKNLPNRTPNFDCQGPESYHRASAKQPVAGDQASGDMSSSRTPMNGRLRYFSAWSRPYPTTKSLPISNPTYRHGRVAFLRPGLSSRVTICLLYTSDAADDLTRVD